MVSVAVHYLLYLAISVCILAPIVAAILVKKIGRAGFAPYFIGFFMYFSITILQSIVQAAIGATNMPQAVVVALYILLFAVIEVLGFYFFTRVFIREVSTPKCLATGVMYGGTIGIMYSFQQIMPLIVIAIAINQGEYEMLHDAAGEAAEMYRYYHDLLVSFSVLEVIPLLLYGAACVAFFAFFGALITNAFDGRPIFYLFAGLAALVYEGPAILISLVQGQEIYSYAYQVVVAIAALVLLRRVLENTTDVSIKTVGEINPRLR